MNVEPIQLVEWVARIREEIARVIIDAEEVVDLALATILCGQHALIEGVPGVGKTLLVRTLARVLGMEFGRIQFTPDLMPADITGTNIFNFQTNSFTLVPGPIFTTFLLADEINRAPAKTQSALLQAMQEREVTIERTTYRLSPHFTVFATQNPVEFEGTYPLPEAQKDRFLLKIPMNAPDREGELQLAIRTLGPNAPEALLGRGEVRALLGADQLQRLKDAMSGITVRDDLVGYAVDIVRATRESDEVLFGAGPRATQALILAARAAAVLDGRDYVTPDDVRRMAPPVLCHRLVLRPEYEVEGADSAQVIRAILDRVPVPR
jgi:MoxR-like ATPase